MHPQTLYLAISCFSVGVGLRGDTDQLAWVSIVDYKGEVVYEHYVLPLLPVIDYRTAKTGLTEAHLQPPLALPFETVQRQVAGRIRNKILVGHKLWHDLSVLGIPHPAASTRDVALYLPFQNALRLSGRVVSLQTMTRKLMCRSCQEGTPHPTENSRAALDLYRTIEQDWEQAIQSKQWPCDTTRDISSSLLHLYLPLINFKPEDDMRQTLPTQLCHSMELHWS